MYQSIVVGTDGSDTARAAVIRAAQFAKAFGAKLHIVSAYKPASQALLGMAEPGFVSGLPDDRQVEGAIEKLVKQVADEVARDGVDVDTYIVPDSPASALIDVAEQQKADLIVVGNRGMTGARRLLGSVPNSVVHHAPCSVLIVDTTD